MLLLVIVLGYRFMKVICIDLKFCIFISQDIDNDHPWLRQYADELKKVLSSFPSGDLMQVSFILFNTKICKIDNCM